MSQSRMFFGLVACAFAVRFGGAIELTPETWEQHTAGKAVFVKFFAPWCGHCKAMKPAWDQLMAKYEGHSTALVADVDCIGTGKELCDEQGVEGFPTIKYGDPSSLEDYEGGRDFDSLQKFAEENLKPMCSPVNLDLCDDEKKKMIEKLLKLSDAELDAEIEKKSSMMAQVNKDFEEEVEKLQEKYQSLDQEKTEKLAAIKAEGFSILKSIKATRGKPKEEL